MTLDLTTLILVGAGVLFAIYLFVPKFRANVNQLFRVVWGKLFGRLVSPIDRQKDQYKQAVELMKQQKESVVKLTATATLAEQELRKRTGTVNTAVEKYNEAKGLGMNSAALDKYALKVREARDAVSSQEGTVKIAQANHKRAVESLARTTEKISKFGQTVLDNESKLALADALNVQAKAEELAGDIDNLLSDSGQAQGEIDRILAEAEARVNLNAPDADDVELEKRRKEKEAAEERARLDGTAQ